MSELVDELIMNGKQHAHKILLELKMKDLKPILAFVTANREVMVTPFGWASMEERAMMIAAAKLVLKEAGAIAYSYIGEAWAIMRKPEWDKQERPSKAKDRIEVVIIAAADATTARCLPLRMQRDPAGQIIALQPEPESKDWPTGGDLAHLLDGVPN